LFPLLALVLTMLPLFQNLDMPWLLWPVVLLIDALAIGLALITGAVLAVVAVLLLTAVVTLVWILHLPAEFTAMPPLLLVLGGFAVFTTGAAHALRPTERIYNRQPREPRALAY